MQEVLGGVRAGVGAEQDGGLAGVQGEGGLAGAVLLAGAVEGLEGRAVVGAVDPVVGGAELERAEFGLGLDGVQGAVQLGHIGVQTLIGVGGNVLVDGNLGLDVAELGSGNYRFNWDPGDSSLIGLVFDLGTDD